MPETSSEKCTIIGPDACSLQPQELRERLAWIAELNAAGLRRHHRRRNRVELIYAPEVADRVHELARRERACCGFLEFDVREGPGTIVLTVRGQGAGALIESVLAAPRPGGEAGCSS